MIIAYITCKDKKEASRIAKHLLSHRLIACANIFPISSMYRWKGKVVRGREAALLCKSTEQQFHNIKKEVKKMHSYQVPCIEKIKAEADKRFAAWVAGEVKKK